MENKIRVTKRKSIIGEHAKTKKVMNALGLKKIGSSRVYKDNNCIRGMVNKVIHLVSYELI